MIQIFGASLGFPAPGSWGAGVGGQPLDSLADHINIERHQKRVLV